MNLRYALHPKADRDVDEIADELVDRGNLDLGLRFLTLAYEAFDLISSQPEMGWSCRLRRKELVTVRVFRIKAPFEKYLIFYQLIDGQIEILRVLHGAQDIDQCLFVD